MADRQATPAIQVARAHLALRRWTGALIGITAVVRSGVGLMTFFGIGPLTGLVAYRLWEVAGNGPLVGDWILAGPLVVAGIGATLGKSIRIDRRARTIGWFVVVDTVVYVVSLALELVTELEFGADLWWKLLAVVVMTNIALMAMGVVVIRKATSMRRLQRALPRERYVRKPRLTDTGTAS